MLQASFSKLLGNLQTFVHQPSGVACVLLIMLRADLDRPQTKGACGLWLLGDLAVGVDCRFLCCVAGLLGSLGLWVLAGFGCRGRSAVGVCGRLQIRAGG